jgi:hypothetical protein
MIPKKLARAKAGVADFSDKIIRKIKENRERCRFNVIEKPSGAGLLEHRSVAVVWMERDDVRRIISMRKDDHFNEERRSFQ